MSNHLKKITVRAKQLQKKHPRTPWTELISKASRQLKSEGKIGAAKKKSNRQTGSSHKLRDSARSARPPGKRTSKSGAAYYERRKNRSDKPGSLTGVSASTLLAEARRRINTDIDKLVVRKFRAPGKRDKKKIQKTITQKKSQLRKLS